MKRKSAHARAIGGLIRSHRKSQKIPLQKLAPKVGVCEKTLRAWEDGHTAPPADRLMLLAALLQRKYRDLIPADADEMTSADMLQRLDKAFEAYAVTQQRRNAATRRHLEITTIIFRKMWALQMELPDLERCHAITAEVLALMDEAEELIAIICTKCKQPGLLAQLEHTLEKNARST